MENVKTITNVTNSGWLISKTIEKDLKNKQVIQLSSLEDDELSSGLQDGTWTFVDETK